MTDPLEIALEIEDHVTEWIFRERHEYADKKYLLNAENYQKRLDDLRENGIGEKSGEVNFLLTYLKRAELLGIDTLAGRQAFGKFVVTAIATLERICVVYGPLPQPGVPSGEIKEWKE